MCSPARNGAINSHGKSKTRLDIDSGVTGWTIHDLRRTARIVSCRRAGVSSDHAELCLGHVLTGVRGDVRSAQPTWTRRRAAFEALAKLIATITKRQP